MALEQTELEYRPAFGGDLWEELRWEGTMRPAEPVDETTLNYFGQPPKIPSRPMRKTDPCTDIQAMGHLDDVLKRLSVPGAAPFGAQGADGRQVIAGRPLSEVPAPGQPSVANLSSRGVES